VSTSTCAEVALNRLSATATSAVGTNSAAMAIDASTGTRWESASADPQSITVDLGQNRYVSKVVLDWETASAKDYVIELSTDNVSWSLAKTVNNTSAVNHRIDTLTGLSGSLVARYVRMRGTTRTTAYGYSLWNFAVYGDNSPSCGTSCTPSCTGKQCGGDGCGGSCGTCGSGLTCNTSNQCVSTGGSCANTALTRSAATASSSVGANTASMAIDANLGTRWESSSADPQWVVVDLGANRYVNSVVLNWETASAKDYVIELSTDNVSWSLAKTVNNTTAVDHRIDTIGGLSTHIARYVRMRGTTRTTVWGYSLWDFTVNGDTNTSCTP
jgi:hypothetical protein